MNWVDGLAEIAAWVGSAAVFACLVYVLAAPPIVLAYVKQTGSGSFPAFYTPVERLVVSDFGGPIVWYFDHVWGLILMGDDSGPPWHIISAYAMIGLAFFGMLIMPFWMKQRRNEALLRLNKSQLTCHPPACS